MSTLLRGIVEAYIPEPRWGAFFEADTTLLRIGHQDHHVLVEALAGRADEMSTDGFITALEGAVVNSLIDCLSEYGIGIKEPRLEYVSKLLQAMFDLVTFEDRETLLNLYEHASTPEEALAEMVAFIYGDVEFEDLIECIDHVSPATLRRLQSTLERRRELPEPELDVAPERQAAVEFLRKHRPPRLLALLDEGYQLGFKVHLYLDKVLNSETMSLEEIALEYVGACVAAGEDRIKSLNLIERRLGHLFDDLLDLQRLIQLARRYLE